MKKLKILLCWDRLARGMGGTERVITELANEMSSRGHKIYLGYACASEDQNTRPVYPIKPEVEILTWGDSTDSRIKFQNKANGKQLDVFMIFYSNWLLVGNFIRALPLQVPIALQECSNPSRVVNENWHGIESANKERMAIASNACRIRVTLPEYKESFRDFIRPQVRAFPNAFDKATTPVNIPIPESKSKYIMHIGGVKENKNFIHLLMAFNKIKDKFPHWNILQCSTMVQNISAWEGCLAFIKRNKLEDRVSIHYNVKDIYSMFRKSEIHAITSMSEGLPGCVCEAMCQGIPSVGYSDCPGVKSLIQHYHNGLLVAPENRIKDLEINLSRLMSDDVLRKDLGKQAWIDADQFDRDKIYEKWETFFNECAEYKGSKEKLLTEQLAVNPTAAKSFQKLTEKVVFYGGIAAQSKPVQQLANAILSLNKKIRDFPLPD